MEKVKRKSQKENKMAKRGLYSNINAKRKRIAAGSGETMRKAVKITLKIS
jgi:hypothetical protein